MWLPLPALGEMGLGNRVRLDLSHLYYHRSPVELVLPTYTHCLGMLGDWCEIPGAGSLSRGEGKDYGTNTTEAGALWAAPAGGQ